VKKLVQLSRGDFPADTEKKENPGRPASLHLLTILHPLYRVLTG
jgi:hypothetical protein